jgi:hypothetical protein
VRDVESGRVDADYGSGVVKQRIARLNEGKSGGYRTVILYRARERAFFLCGFSKSEQGNIDTGDEHRLKELAKVTLALSDDELVSLLKKGTYKEVRYEYS